MKEIDLQKIVPTEEDENVGGEPPKKKEKKRKSKEERAADRRVIFWFLFLITLLTSLFYIWPIYKTGSWSDLGKLNQETKSKVDIHQEVIKEMEKPGWRPYTEVKF